MSSLPSLVHGDGFVEVLGGDAVGDEVRGFGAGHGDPGTHHDAGQAVAADGGPEQLVLRPIRCEGAHLAVGHQQVHRQHVIAEAPGAVVILAVDV